MVSGNTSAIAQIVWPTHAFNEASPTVRIANVCNAVKRDASGWLVGDMFDGEGLLRGVLRKCCVL